VGTPTDTTKAYILEPNTTNQLGIGQSGELCLAGLQVAAGYYHRSEQTAAAFISNPFGDGKLYPTGDHGVRYKDGAFEITGRIDYHLKINGQRLEPEEVTTKLAQSPDVQALVAIGATIKDRLSLISVIVTKPEMVWTNLIHDLREKARRTLTPYMVPSYWLQLDSLPTNANGKIDIKALREHAQSTSPENMLGPSIGDLPESKPPSNDFEHASRDVGAKVLGLDSKIITRSSVFTALGGSSMDAIQVVRELRAQDMLVELGDILKAQRLSEIPFQQGGSNVDMIEYDSNRLALVSNGEIHAQLAGDHGVFDADPLSQFQGSILASTLSGNLDYLYQRTYDIRHLNLSKLKLAFTVVFHNSEILRTNFTSTKVGILQVVRNDFELPWK